MKPGQAPIGDFDQGDLVVTDDWLPIEVTGLDPGSSERGLAYNLTVAETHTYHVGVHDVLVHNTSCGIEGDVPNPKNATKAATDEPHQVVTNRAKGNAFRDQVADRLADEGFNVVGTEVGMKTSLGMRYVDILAERNGTLVGFETKLGKSRYLPAQRAKD